MKTQKMKLKKQFIFRKEDKIIVIIMAIFITTYILLSKFTMKSEDVLSSIAKNKSIELSTLIINESLKEIIINNDLNSIININKNSDEEIVNIDLNTMSANKILYEVNDAMMKNIKKLERNELNKIDLEYLDDKDNIFKVPFGVIHNMPILTSLSPKIPFKISILGNISNEMLTKIKEYGINNSLVELKIKCIVNIQIILPFKIKEIKNEKEILLSSQIIQGKIPEYYGGIMSSTLKKQ